MVSSIFALSEVNGRERNEDSFIVLPLPDSDGSGSLMLAVADGIGGAAHGEEVSREVIHALALSILDRFIIDSALNHPTDRFNENVAVGVSSHITANILEPASPPDKKLVESLVRTHQHVREMIQEHQWPGAGSTVVVALIHHHEALVVNMGDSPLFHYRVRADEIQQITEDHNLAGEYLREGKITLEESHDPDSMLRSRLIRFIGDCELPPDLIVHTVLLQPGDRLLLCSDGINGRLPLQRIQLILGAASVPLSQIADELIEAARQMGETDNQTLIIYEHPRRQDITSTHVIESVEHDPI